MAKSLPTSFVINTTEGPRSLLTVRENNKHDLFIVFRGSDLSRDHGIPIDFPGSSDRHRTSIRQRKVSVHPSPMSKTDNQIHLSQITSDGKKIESHHISTAIKTYNRFAVVWTHWFSRLENRSNLVKTGRHLVNLGEFDESHFNLVLMVAVARHDRKFLIDTDDFNYTQKRFNKFNFIVLWSFAPWPSTEHSISHVPMATPSSNATFDPGGQILARVMAGYTEQEIVSYFKMARDLLRLEIIATVLNWIEDHPDVCRNLLLLSQVGYFREGIVTPGHNDEMRKRIASIIPTQD